jgi:hypothetical protein
VRCRVLLHIPFTIYFLAKVENEMLFILCYKNFIYGLYHWKLVGSESIVIIDNADYENNQKVLK